MIDLEKEAINRFVIAYNDLLEEVKQLRDRRIAMLTIIEDQRADIARLKKELAEEDEYEKNRRTYQAELLQRS